MNIGPLTIEIGRGMAEDKPRPKEEAPTADELLETAAGAKGIVETAKKRLGRASMPIAEAEVARLMREASEAKAAEEAGRCAVKAAVILHSDARRS